MFRLSTLWAHVSSPVRMPLLRCLLRRLSATSTDRSLSRTRHRQRREGSNLKTIRSRIFHGRLHNPKQDSARPFAHRTVKPKSFPVARTLVRAHIGCILVWCAFHNHSREVKSRVVVTPTASWL